MMESSGNDVEENTGIEFPGESIEPWIGHVVTLEDDIYDIETSTIVVEFSTDD